MATRIRVRFVNGAENDWRAGREIFRQGASDVEPHGGQEFTAVFEHMDEASALAILKQISGIEIVDQISNNIPR